jgi:L-lactate dehydrogenase complex protein LldG
MGREEILQRVKSNKPELVALPEIDTTKFLEDVDVVSTFKKNVEVVGGKLYTIASEDKILEQVKNLFPKSVLNYAALPNAEDFNTIDLITQYSPQELGELDVLVIKGTIGVAENGAVWITNNDFSIRVLPFITKHLVLVIDAQNFVANMHEAYEKLAGIPRDFGVFISGPSKTADIEQSLVIGAQGALSLSVFVVE